MSVSLQNIVQIIESDTRLHSLVCAANRIVCDDPAHDRGHILRVAEWGCRILSVEFPNYTNNHRALLVAAAFLHDCVNIPKNHPDRALAGERSADVATAYLIESGFSRPDIHDVTEAIAVHGFSRGIRPTTMLGKALQDADRLDALGAIGIMRLVSVSTRIGSAFFSLLDPWGIDRPLNDGRFALDHIPCKLAKLPALMNTETARVEAEKRLYRIRNWLDDLRDEIGNESIPISDDVLGWHSADTEAKSNTKVL